MTNHKVFFCGCLRRLFCFHLSYSLRIELWGWIPRLTKAESELLLFYLLDLFVSRYPPPPMARGLSIASPQSETLYKPQGEGDLQYWMKTKVNVIRMETLHRLAEREKESGGGGKPRRKANQDNHITESESTRRAQDRAQVGDLGSIIDISLQDTVRAGRKLSCCCGS